MLSDSEIIITLNKDDFIFIHNSRSLNEKTIHADGQQWVFNKTDKDPWPSYPHGHFETSKLNPFTGEVFDVNTKKLIYKLKPKVLSHIKDELKANKNFASFFQDN